MDSFDRRILSVLRDGKPRDFGQLLKLSITAIRLQMAVCWL